MICIHTFVHKKKGNTYIHTYIGRKNPINHWKRESSPWHSETNNPLGVIKRLIILYDEKEEVFS
jgi:hypothetical protein